MTMVVICPKCGKRMIVDEKDPYVFCAQCGYKINLSAEAKTDTPSQPYQPETQFTSFSQYNTQVIPEKKKQSKLGSAALLLSLFCLPIVGLILGIIDLSKKDDSQKHGYAKAAIIIGIVMMIIYSCVFTNTLVKKGTESLEESVQVESTNIAEKATQPSKTPQIKANPNEKNVQTGEMKIGQYGKAGDLFVGLSGVRRIGYVETATSFYTQDIDSNQEMIYVILEVKNNSDKILTYSKSNISVYVDGIIAPEPDCIYLLAIDGIQEYQSYELDAYAKSLVIFGCLADKGWNELSIFSGNLQWKVTSDADLDTIYHYTSLFNDSDVKYDYSNKTLDAKNHEIVYDGFTIHTMDILGDTQKYAVFMVTINNTSSESIDYSLVGYNMRAYQNNILLDDCNYVMDEVIDGYQNIFNIDDLKPGMTAKVYLSFEINSETGIFKLAFDEGYITNEYYGDFCVQH